MASLECNINSSNGEATVTYKVLKLGVADEITFTSNDPNTGIEYERRSPFKDSEGPQADQPFPIGKKAGPFMVKVPSDGEPRHFVCGLIGIADATGVGSRTATTKFQLKPWKGGGDTP
jgi:hypothetical protein